MVVYQLKKQEKSLEVIKVTRKSICSDFFCQDPRFSYEADGCGPCISRKKTPPVVTQFLPTQLEYEKCLKNHMVKTYKFREEALQEPLKKETQFIIGIKLPQGINRQQVKDVIEAAIESEVLILLEGYGTLGAGYMDSEFFGAADLGDLGFTSREEKKED